MKNLYEIVKRFLNPCLTTSTIHGLNHLAQNHRRHPIETFTWLFFVAASIYAISVLSGVALRRYTENPTVISMERDRFSWNTSFPTATVCPINKLNTERLDEFVAKRKKNTTEAALLREFLVKLSLATYDNFNELPMNDGIAAEDYMVILLDLAFRFKPSVTNSGISNAKKGLQRTVTEMGVCYSFNSQLAVYNAPEYMTKNATGSSLQDDEIFYVNPLDGDVFVSLMNMSNGVYVRHNFFLIAH